MQLKIWLIMTFVACLLIFAGATQFEMFCYLVGLCTTVFVFELFS